MRFGILGGSFNPIHHGHLIIATRAAEALSLDRVLLIPTARSPLKAPGDLAGPRDRLAMVRLAVRGNPLLEASDLEVRRGGTSYTVDTLRQLRRILPGEFVLILGADAARLLPRWRSIEEVRHLARVAVVGRGGLRPREKTPKGSMVPVPEIDISSTDIRERVRRGLPIRYLVPEAVERFIRRKRLYRS
jgi:nicotinate-nucleotide adenylyltransferase